MHVRAPLRHWVFAGLVDSLRSLGLSSVLDVRAWHNVLWQVQVLSQVLHTLLGQGVVVVLPRELGLDVTSRSQRLQRLDHVQVLAVNFLVLRLVEVLLGNNNTLLEQVAVNLVSVSLGNQHYAWFCLLVVWSKRYRFNLQLYLTTILP